MQTVVDAIGGRSGRGALDVVGSAAVSWADIHRRARGAAGELMARGVRRGDRVALLGEPHADLVVAMQAAWLAGAAFTVLPLPVRGASGGYAEQLLRIVADARPRLLLAAAPVPSTISRAVPVAGLHSVAAGGVPLEPMAPAADDLAILQFSRGPARAPRGVPVTHGRLAAQLAAIRTATDHDRVHGRMLSWLPLHHDMGLIGMLGSSMSCGCDLTLMSAATFAARPMSWLELIAARRATVIAAPNFAWDLAARLLRTAPITNLSRVRRAISGGEPADPEVMARFFAAAAVHGFDPRTFIAGYGLATMSPPGAGLCTDTVDPAALERRSVAVKMRSGRVLARLGLPMPGARIRIVDEDGRRPLDERQVGHVEVAGDLWGTPTAPPGRWLRTGELGYLAEGELVICGRAAPRAVRDRVPALSHRGAP